MKVSQHGSHTAHVIAMRMGECDHVQSADSTRPEIRGNNLFADIPASVGGLRRANLASRVDQHGGSLRRSQQDRVSLANIERRDFELSLMQRSAVGPCDRKHRHRKQHDRQPYPAAATPYQPQTPAPACESKEHRPHRRRGHAKIDRRCMADPLRNRGHGMQQQRCRGRRRNRQPR